MSSAFVSIMQGLKEIQENQQGRRHLRTTTVQVQPVRQYDASAIKSLRTSLRLSQSAFALVMGVSRKTVEAWEGARNAPSGSSCRLIEVISKDTSILQRGNIISMS